MLKFILGVMIGAFIGIALMCILQVSKSSDERY